MFSSPLFLLIGIGTLTFIGYLFFTFRTHASAPKADDEETQDLHTIQKMKEFQLIKDTKKVQSLSEKNKLFLRAYENKFGVHSLEETRHQEQQQEQQEEGEEFVQTESLQNPKVTTYQPEENEYDFSDAFYSERSVPETESPAPVIDEEEAFAANEIQKLSQEFSTFDPLSLQEIGPSESYLRQQQEKESSSDTIIEKQLEDDYTPSEQMAVAVLHQQFLHMMKL